MHSPTTALPWAADGGATRFPQRSQHRERNASNTAEMCGSQENLGPPQMPPTQDDVVRHLEI